MEESKQAIAAACKRSYERRSSLSVCVDSEVDDHSSQKKKEMN